MNYFHKIKNIIIRNKNHIFLFLFLNYILFFLVKTTKISFFEFTSNKEISLIVYLFWALQSFLVKKSVIIVVLTLFSIPAFFVLDYLACCYLYKLSEYLIKNATNKLNFIESDYFIVVFLLAFSAVLRFAFLNAGLYHHDSFQLAVAVEKTLEDNHVYEIAGGRQGVVLVNAFFFYLFKVFLGHESAEFTVNFSSALFGTMSVAILYFLVKNLTNDKFVSFSSGILYSVTPLFLSVSTFAKEHTLDVFTSLLSILLLVIGLKKLNYFYISLSGLFLSLLILIRFPSVLIFFSMVFLIYNFDKMRKEDAKLNKLKAFCFFLTPFAIFILLYFLFGFSTFLNEAKNNFNLISFGDTHYLLNFKYSVEVLFLTLTILGFLFSIIGLMFLFKGNRKLFYFILLFFIPLFIFYASSKTVSDRFFSLPLVPLVIALSYALGYIKKKDSYVSALILILFTILFLVSIYPIIKLRHEFSAFKDMAFMVNSNTNPQDSIVILYGDDTPALNYYSKVPVMSCDYEPESKMIRKFISQINEKMNSGFRVFISGACFGLGTFEEQKLFLDIMDLNFKGSIVAEYVSDDYHRGAIKPTIKKVSMIMLYALNSAKGDELANLIIRY